MKLFNIKRAFCFMLSLLLLTAIFNTGTVRAESEKTSFIYEYTSMLEDNGYIYYIQTVQGTTDSYDIYRINPVTGDKNKIISSDNYIRSMVLYNNILYYTSNETDSTEFTTYSVSVKGQNKQTVSKGTVLYADKYGIYYTVDKDTKCLLYKKSHSDKKAVLLYTGNSSFEFVKSIGTTLYFGQYKDSTSQIQLLSLKSGNAKPTVLSSLKTEQLTSSIPIISDIVSIKGNLYYQFGTYEGSGSFWYGTLVKYTTGEKSSSIITDSMITDTLDYSSNKIYFYDMENSSKYYSYNVNTGKITTFTNKVSGNESISIVNNYSYRIGLANKNYITISRYTSGTNYKNLDSDFIKIANTKNSTLDYTAGVTSLGKYLMIPVKCTDYNDADYGWRGKVISIKWYVADSSGKVLTNFQ
jgi:hypothetical protein